MIDEAKKDAVVQKLKKQIDDVILYICSRFRERSD